MKSTKKVIFLIPLPSGVCDFWVGFSSVNSFFGIVARKKQLRQL